MPLLEAPTLQLQGAHVLGPGTSGAFVGQTPTLRPPPPPLLPPRLRPRLVHSGLLGKTHGRALPAPNKLTSTGKFLTSFISRPSVTVLYGKNTPINKIFQSD